MAKPDTKTEEQQGSAIARAGGYPVGFLTPGDCSRMTPFSLIRRMTEEMDGVFGEFALSRGEAGKPTWSPEVKLEIADDAIVLEGERWMETVSYTHLWPGLSRHRRFPAGGEFDRTARTGARSNAGRLCYPGSPSSALLRGR